MSLPTTITTLAENNEDWHTRGWEYRQTSTTSSLGTYYELHGDNGAVNWNMGIYVKAITNGYTVTDGDQNTATQPMYVTKDSTFVNQSAVDLVLTTEYLYVWTNNTNKWIKFNIAGTGTASGGGSGGPPGTIGGGSTITGSVSKVHGNFW